MATDYETDVKIFRFISLYKYLLSVGKWDARIEIMRINYLYAYKKY